jgi:hypothetical protein
MHWLIRHAARGAPESLSSRLEEEWLADLESRSSAQSRLRLAFGCCWAAIVIVNEYAGTGDPTAVPVVAARAYIPRTENNFGYFSLGAGTLFLILGLHAALFSGLVTTFSHPNGWMAQKGLLNQASNPASVEVTVLPGR